MIELEKKESIYHYKKSDKFKKKNNIAALINLSIILKEYNNYEELLEVYEKILNLEPPSIEHCLHQLKK